MAGYIRGFASPAEELDALVERALDRDARKAFIELFEEIQNRLTAAMDLHKPHPLQTVSICLECDMQWPCVTATALGMRPPEDIQLEEG